MTPNFQKELFFSNLFIVKNGTFTFLDQNDKDKEPIVINDFSFVSDNLSFSKKSISFKTKLAICL